jgi:hypothetical protein
MVHFFREPVIIPNEPTDIPDGQPGGGKPSDHSVVYTEPQLERSSNSAREVVIKITRRINEDAIRKFAQWIHCETWEQLLDAKSEMALRFRELVFGRLDQICPAEEVKLAKLDGQVTSLALQKLSRLRLREHTKNGNS